MSDDLLGDRRKALENEFFSKQDEALIRNLRDQEQHKQRRAALESASGIHDASVIDAMLEQDIHAETFAALSLIPLVAVAWADGSVDAKERQAVLAAAGESGLSSDDVSHQLLEEWMLKQPEAALIQAWKDYVKALEPHLGAEPLDALKRDLLERARGVAAATGGFLGLGNKVSATEQAVLDDLASAFE